MKSSFTRHAAILAALLFCAANAAVFAQTDAVVEVAPLVSVPLGSSTDLFGFGFGGQLQGVFPFGESPLAGFGSVDYTHALLQGGAGAVDLVRLGGGVLYDVLGVGPLTIGLDAHAGGYVAMKSGADTLANPYVGAGARLALGLGSAFELSIQPSYDAHLASRDGSIASFYSGLTTVLSIALAPAKLSTGTRKPRILIQPPAFGEVLPVIYKYYDDHPFGSVTVRNDESSTIKNVKVEFIVPQYMSAPQTIAEIPEMSRGESKEVPITALFSNQVLDITEADSLQSQVIVTYDVGSTSLTSQRNTTMRIEDRNAINWDDDRKAAAFITSRDPSILRFSRNVTTAASDDGVGAVNERFRSGLALFYALHESGIRYQVDPNSAYSELSQNASAVDYVQFPVQTLDYRAGDCDDLAVLYCAMLESVGIRSALITIPGHIYAAFALEMSEEDARKTFNAADDLIYQDGQAWVPVETTLIEEDFLQAWSTGAQEWREASGRNVASFYGVGDAQSVYEPTWFGSGTQDLQLPDPQVVAVTYRAELKTFVSREIGPLVDEIKARLATRRSPSLVNRLGTIYARYGLLDDAQVAFREAADANYVPALVNMGNIYYIKRDLQSASRYYTKAQQINPDDPEALVGLARTDFELENYDAARQNIALARVLDPAVAGPYAYIGGEDSDAARASNAQTHSIVPWAE